MISQTNTIRNLRPLGSKSAPSGRSLRYQQEAFLFSGALTMTATKRCSKCKEIKPLEKFSREKRVQDGRRSECKICFRERDRRYYQTEKGKAAIIAGEKRYRLKHPEKRKARNAVTHAIETGRLLPTSSFGCYYCSAPAQHYHHQNGYTEEHRLDVVPVCRKCHKEIHKKSAKRRMICQQKYLFVM